MERWNVKKSKRAINPRIDVFLEEVISVCEKHGYSISHEDGHGGFIIETWHGAGDDEGNFDWLREASDDT